MSFRGPPLGCDAEKLRLERFTTATFLIQTCQGYCLDVKKGLIARNLKNNEN